MLASFFIYSGDATVGRRSLALGFTGQLRQAIYKDP